MFISTPGFAVGGSDGRRWLYLEDDVRAQGLEPIQLDVFGGNERARSFYRSLGYTEQAVHMGKRLGPS